jgi:hypothetical protein
MNVSSEMAIETRRQRHLEFNLGGMGIFLSEFEEEMDPAQSDGPVTLPCDGISGGGGGGGGGGGISDPPTVDDGSTCPSGWICVTSSEPLPGNPIQVTSWAPFPDDPIENIGLGGPLPTVGDGGGGGLSVKNIINAALKLPNLGKCLNMIFGPGNILSNSNLPTIDNTHSTAQISQITGVAARGETADGTTQTPVPVSGPGTVLIASEYFGPNPGVSPLYVTAIYVHETGNILATQLFGNAYARPSSNPALRGADRDTGQNFEDCVFGGIVAANGTVSRNP